MRSLLEHTGLLLVVSAAMWYVGYPVRRLLVGPRRDFFGIEAITGGAAVFAVVLWYWSSLTGSGAAVAVPAIMAAVLPLWYLARRGERPPVRPAQFAREVALFIAVAAAAVGVFTLHYPDYWNADSGGAVTLGNNDVAYYALAAQHLTHSGFDDPGRFLSHDLGEATRADITGAFFLLSTASIVTQQDVARISMVVATFALVAVLAALARLLRTMSGMPLWAGIAAGTVAVASETFFYSVYQVFIAHLLAVAVMVLLLDVAMSIARSSADGTAPRLTARRALFRDALRIAVLEVWLVMVYPHMAFLTLPFIVALAVTWNIGEAHVLASARRTILRSIVAIFGGFVLVGLLLPERMLVAARITFGIGGAVAGWSLGRVTPGQLIGVVGFPSPPTGTAVPSLADAALPLGALTSMTAVAILVLVASIPASVTRARVMTSIVIGVVPFLVATALFSRYGEVYQGWKGPLFFQPLAPIAALTAVWFISGLFQFARRSPRGRAIAFAGAAFMMFILTLDAAGLGRHEFRGIDRDLRVAAARVDDLGIDSLNLDIGGPSAFWDNMWAGYLIDDIELYPVEQTYLRPALPRASWTLRLAVEAAGPAERRVEVVGRFALDRREGAQPAASKADSSPP